MRMWKWLVVAGLLVSTAGGGWAQPVDLKLKFPEGRKARYKSKFKGKDKSKSLLSLAGLGSQPPPSDFGKGKKGGTGKSKRSDRDEQWRSNVMGDEWRSDYWWNYDRSNR